MPTEKQIHKEMDNIGVQFPGQAFLDLDDYSALFKIGRKRV
jgi:hypothetical protein